MRRWPEALFAVGTSAGLWLLLVPGATVAQYQRRLPVEVENLPAGYALESVEPTEVEVVLRGRRRDVYLALQQDKLSIKVDALLVQLGRRTFDVGPEQVEHPASVTPVSVAPARVKLNVVQGNAG